jgi:predicted SAM-dependent methyltransferase
LKINLGCGKRNFGPEWIHIDGQNYDHIVSNDIINFNYNNVHLIYASHVLEYFDQVEAINLLKKWKSKLIKGGILRLAVPNFKIISELYLKKQFKLESFIGPLYGRMEMNGQTIYHKTVYDEYSLKNLLNEVGFKKIQKWDWKKTEHSNHDDHSQAYLPKMDKENGTLISLNIEAVND